MLILFERKEQEVKSTKKEDLLQSVRPNEIMRCCAFLVGWVILKLILIRLPPSNLNFDASDRFPFYLRAYAILDSMLFLERSN